MSQSAYVFKTSMRRKFTPILYGSEKYDYLRESEVVKKNEITTRVQDSRLQPKCKWFIPSSEMLRSIDL